MRAKLEELGVEALTRRLAGRIVEPHLDYYG
jgi:hypothetical protein